MLVQANGGKYLNAQIFTGFMYVGAALCMWFLRAWKIGQLELLASDGESVREQKPRARSSTGRGHLERLQSWTSEV